MRYQVISSSETYLEWNSSKPREEHAVLGPQAVMNVSQTDVRDYLQPQQTRLQHSEHFTAIVNSLRESCITHSSQHGYPGCDCIGQHASTDVQLTHWRPLSTAINRVSTNLTEQISRRFPGGISRKIQDMFALLWPAMQCTESTSLPKYRTKTW